MAPLIQPRITLLGAGMSAQNIWVPALKALGLVISSVIDPNEAAREKLRPYIHGVFFEGELSEKIMSQTDLVIIASPNRFHVEHACLCLSHGVNVVIEKPVCFTSEDAEKIIQTAQENGSAFWCSAASTFRLDVQRITQLIHSGSIGDIFNISLSWRRSQGVPRPGSWFTNQDMAIGGSGADLGWHLLDVGLGLLDYPKITSANSVSTPLIAKSDYGQHGWYDADMEYEPQAAATPFSVENQMLATLATTSCQIWLSTAWASHQSFDMTTIKILGTLGEIDLQCTFGFSPKGIRNSFLTFTQNGTEDRFILSETQKIDPYVRFAAHVVQSLHSGDTNIDGEAAKLRSLSCAMQHLYPRT